MKLTRLVMSHTSTTITENLWQILKATDHSLLSLNPKELCRNGCCPVIIEHAKRVLKKAG